MGLWLKVHREVTGAWRSARYDMYRQVSQRKLTQLLTAETAEFTGRHLQLHRQRQRARTSAPGRPRRFAATSGVALLVAGGAAGTYLAVAGSLTALRTAPPAAVAAAVEPTQVADVTVSGDAAVSAQPTHVRPQVRRSAPSLLAAPAAPSPVNPPPTTNTPESTPTPSVSPSPTVSGSPSPSAVSPSTSGTVSKTPKRGQSNVGTTGR